MSFNTLFKQLRGNFSYKFVRDFSWSFVASVFGAFAGILLNVLVGNIFGAEGLGVFNKSFAFYTVLSVLLSSGFTTAVIKFSAENLTNKDELKSILMGGILGVLFLSIFFSVIFYLVINKWGLIWSGNDTRVINYLLLGLPVFVLNKVLLGFSNGLRQMKLYSIIQFSRWILILLGLAIVSIYSNKLFNISIVFTFVEVLIAIVLLFYYRRFISFWRIKHVFWFKKQLVFGGKVFFNSAMSQVNTKLDILITSVFLSDSSIGIYSFASTLANGLFAFFSPIQTNINPIISKLIAGGEIGTLKKYIERVQKYSYVLMSSLGIVIAIGYYFLVKLFMRNPIYEQSLVIFYILLVAIVFRAFYNWSGGLLTMAGLPEDVAKITIFVVILNTIFSILLITTWGILGAAIATAIYNFLIVFVRDLFTRKRLGLKILPFNLY